MRDPSVSKVGTDKAHSTVNFPIDPLAEKGAALADPTKAHDVAPKDIEMDDVAPEDNKDDDDAPIGTEEDVVDPKGVEEGNLS